MKIGSPLPRDTKELQRNRSAQETLLAQLNQHLGTLSPPDSEEAVQRHKKRGKLLARERVERLLDPGAPFLEIGALAGLDLYPDARAGAGIITGIGTVSGRPCVIVANDATVKGGTYFPLTVKKHLRAQEIARENRLPCIYLVDSGGAFLPLQDQVFPDRDHFGRIFYNQATMSAEGIAQISVVMGSCTAGGAYVPAMSDEAIIVRNQGTVFLGGPPLVKAATGQEVSAEELGGAEVHSRISGVTDHLAENDEHALELARRAVATLPFADTDSHPALESATPPAFSEDDILSLVPSDPRTYFPIRELLARIIDGSELDEFKSEYGTTLICGFARIEGQLTGILANDGILFSESALKGAHFIELCSQRRIPLVFFQNIMGFMVGREYEHKGIAKDGAKLVSAVSCAQVPKFTVVVGGSFGAGNYGMAGRAFQPRMLFMWPNARIAVMGPTQAAEVLTQVKRDSMSARGQKWPTRSERAYHEEIEQQYLRQSNALYSTARLWDDGVVDPRHTRQLLSLGLAASRGAPIPPPRFGVFRM